MIYLISPYSSPDDRVRTRRWLDAEHYCAYALRQGQPVFSPVVYCHTMAAIHKLPTDFGFWMQHNLDWLKSCAEARVLLVDGWAESTGVMREIAEANDIGIPIRYIHDLSSGYFLHTSPLLHSK